jgi:hypothetical protein
MSIEVVQFIISLILAIIICSTNRITSRVKLFFLHFFLVAVIALIIDNEFQSQFTILTTSKVFLPRATAWLLVFFLWCLEVAIIPFFLASMFIKRKVAIQKNETYSKSKSD